ncbi:hypothetical protein ACN38_g3141 [Penicillium nordicum]|uniref:Uncharacterized protein n=1 Tax=Penicillium nordicum TaxID=229535 RepID=A0A0M9WIA7_9EURO|nr:hypothetical protein ACN38_g3141 [Penicillium nordicum]
MYISISCLSSPSVLPTCLYNLPAESPLILPRCVSISAAFPKRVECIFNSCLERNKGTNNTNYADHVDLPRFDRSNYDMQLWLDITS